MFPFQEWLDNQEGRYLWKTLYVVSLSIIATGLLRHIREITGARSSSTEKFFSLVSGLLCAQSSGVPRLGYALRDNPWEIN